MSAKRNKKFHRTDIHQVGFWYKALRPLVDFVTAMSFRRIQVLGMENIPDDGAVIFAPNHCNTLMDALVVLRTRRGPTVFGARADMFENPVAAKALHFLKIVPIVRRRDGIRKVIRNLDIIDDIVEVLDENVPFCIFPEGTHRPMHSLLPVGKGVFRIAVTANEKIGKPVYVVPVGIEYGDYYRYASTSLVQFGKPIAVTEYLNSHPDSQEAETYRHLTATLRESLEGLITYIPDDEDYEAKWAYTKVMTAGRKSTVLADRLRQNKDVIGSIVPEKLPLALEFEKERKEARVSIFSFGYDGRTMRAVLKTIGLLLWAPFQVCFGLLALPSIALSEFLVARKIKDKAFANSIRMACTLLVNTLWIIIWALILLCSGFDFKCGVLALIVMVSAPLCFYQGLEWYRIWLSDLRLLKRKDLVDKFESIRK